MKLFEFLKQIPGLFDWYFKLSPLKRIQLNYIVLLFCVLTLFYFNDKFHRENLNSLSIRIDLINDSRAKEQEKYTARLEFYTEKFNNLLEMLLRQEKKIEAIKKEGE